MSSRWSSIRALIHRSALGAATLVLLSACGPDPSALDAAIAAFHACAPGERCVPGTVCSRVASGPSFCRPVCRSNSDCTGYFRADLRCQSGVDTASEQPVRVCVAEDSGVTGDAAFDAAGDAAAADGGFDASVRVDAADACVPDCSTRTCGPDGCGGECGKCGFGHDCTNGTCSAACNRDCTGRECGPDGCLGSCGSCAAGTCGANGRCDARVRCVNLTICNTLNPTNTRECGPLPGQPDCSCGVCRGDQYCNSTGHCQIYPCNAPQVQFAGGCCTPRCDGRDCGSNGCGGTCGRCPSHRNEYCSNLGRCECTPNCTSSNCGDDGCGGSCGTCAAGQVCRPSSPSRSYCCTPNCTGRACGDDGCGGSCGTCPTGYHCTIGSGERRCVVCTPSCTGSVCGSDGCGGSCGNCPAGQSCSSGRCVGGCTRNCTARVCGDDGCGGSCGVCGGGLACSGAGLCVSTGGCTDNTHCLQLVSAVRGTHCSSAASAEVTVRNACTSTIVAKLCLRRSDGACDCVRNSALAPGDTLFNFVCSSGGSYTVIGGASGDSESCFPSRC